MPRPDTPFEAASYDLKQFRERRMAERRAVPRAGADRRAPVEHDRRKAANDVPILMMPPVEE
ncbi:MAG TPA: hypothetical protein VM406_12085 [Noviherbaspirillum sp.]|nr:hypothetical protein [Noviherbaspirillum sp.]